MADDDMDVVAEIEALIALLDERRVGCPATVSQALEAGAHFGYAGTIVVVPPDDSDRLASDAEAAEVRSRDLELAIGHLRDSVSALRGEERWPDEPTGLLAY